MSGSTGGVSYPPTVSYVSSTTTEETDDPSLTALNPGDGADDVEGQSFDTFDDAFDAAQEAINEKPKGSSYKATVYQDSQGKFHVRLEEEGAAGATSAHVPADWHSKAEIFGQGQGVKPEPLW